MAERQATVVVLESGTRAGPWSCKSLQRGGYRVVGTGTAGSGRSAARFCDDFVDLPSSEQSISDYLSALGAVCDRFDAAAVFPGDHEGATQLLSAHGAVDRAVAVAPGKAQYDALCDKAGLDRTAAHVGLDRPRTWILETPGLPETPTLPCIVKPGTTKTVVLNRVVHRSAVLAGTRAELADAVRDVVDATGSAIVEERIVGTHWRIHFAAAGEGFSGVPVTTVRSYPRAAGMSTIQVVPSDAPSALFDLSERLLGSVGYRGVGSVQFIERDRRFFVHDVNLRVPSSVALSMKAGLDMPRLAVDMALGRSPDLASIETHPATYLWLGGELRAVRDAPGLTGRLGESVRVTRDATRALVQRSGVVDLPVESVYKSLRVVRGRMPWSRA